MDEETLVPGPRMPLGRWLWVYILIKQLLVSSGVHTHSPTIAGRKALLTETWKTRSSFQNPGQQLQQRTQSHCQELDWNCWSIVSLSEQPRPIWLELLLIRLVGEGAGRKHTTWRGFSLGKCEFSTCGWRGIERSLQACVFFSLDMPKSCVCILSHTPH